MVQPREAGVFALGFAAGALCLVVAMWAAGVVKPASTPAAAPTLPVSTSLPGPPVPAPTVSDFSSPELPREPLPSVPAAAAGDADRIAPDRLAPDHAGGVPDRPHNLIVPVKGVEVSHLVDNFNDARNGHKHEALDIPAARGTPVVAAAEGNVVKLFTSKQGGLTVYQFDNSGTWCYYYAHLDHYAPALREGMLLRKGDVLGFVGTTGDAPPNAPHLHFAIFRLGPDKKWWQGTAIDPFPILRGQ